MAGEEDQKIIETLVPPELHLMTGVVGKLINELEDALNEDGEGTKFMNHFHQREDVRKCVYQGSNSYEGNQAKKLLEKADILERDIKKTFNFQSITKALPFIEALRKFRDVVYSCFGLTLDPKYKEVIQKFSDQYRKLHISVTPKVHIVETHVIEYIQLRNESAGLGHWSEQAMESTHHDFKEEWSKVKVSLNNKEFYQKLLQTVIRYNGKHI